MPIYEQPTPCPLPWAGPRLATQTQQAPHQLLGSSTSSSRNLASSRQSFYVNDDDTANLDFTTEVRAGIRAAAPRRRPRKTMRAFEPSLEICEDAVELNTAESIQPQSAVTQSAIVLKAGTRRTSVMPVSAIMEEGGNVPRRSAMMLAQPAARLPPSKVAGTRAPARRRVSALLAERAQGEEQRPLAPAALVTRSDPVAEPSRPTREPRRRTIFIPSDDTTIITIHPGGWQAEEASRLGRLESNRALVRVPEEERQPRQAERRPLAPPPQLNRVSRQSLAAAPRRSAMPLQQTSRAVQSTTSYKNVAGQGGGKENVPPGWDGMRKKQKADDKGLKSRITITIDDKPKARAAASGSVMIRTNSTTAVSRRPNVSISNGSHKRTSSDTAVRQDRPKVLKARSHASEEPKTVISTARVPSTRLKSSHNVRSDLPLAAPTKLNIPSIAVTVPQELQHYPLLEDDIRNPQMYEDDWLSHQEKGILHLINALFEAADTNARHAPVSHQDLRKRLLDHYQAAPFPLLHKRLQASLLYGALSIPKDVLANASRLQDDIGQKKKFLGLWTETYHPAALKAAAEVVIGRTIPLPRASSSSGNTSDAHARRELRSISSFLETFLIRNDDAVRVRQGLGSIASIARTTTSAANLDNQTGWGVRRTLLRSLMLILLLDQSKSAASPLLSTPLFLPSSPHKSTVSVLHSLTHLLHPTLGDFTRPLSHLAYLPSHTQAPLEEYSYPITNLATDLRDGVRLTRLVELLLYPLPTLMEPHSRQRSSDSSEEVTISLPTGELLTSAIDQQPLSRHLKLPCISRATKLYNAQIALSALPPSVAIAKGVSAEDVVNGHRERTISLLWALVSTWGLHSLVPVSELKQEIERLSRAHPSDLKQQEHPTARSDPAHLLQHWAATIARSRGLSVTNLSTSFASGAVFCAIVDAYLPFFPASAAPTPPSMLDAKLVHVVGSTSLFTSPQHVSSKETTLPLLALLAARLLPPSRRSRAASAIQRAYRVHLARCHRRRLVALQMLARDCVMVVQTRERVVGAAVVIQLAWRRWLRARGRVVA